MHLFASLVPASAPVRICAVIGLLGLLVGFIPTGAAAPADAPSSVLPTLFVVGDSTARNSANGAQGWGDPLAGYFDSTKINVLNRARAGRSSRTFVTEGLWDRVLAEMKAGDYAHTSPAGAERNAASVVAGLKGLRNLPLLNCLSEKGKAVPSL